MSRKKWFWILGLMIGLPLTGRAQLAFWNYDDFDNESQIPTECDGVFDENRGGVFVPTAREMAEQGEEFLLDADPTIRNKAGYCLIAAAVQGDIPAQYRVAQLYAKGIVLPQDDLSAYRWAFLASLNGHPEATKLALLLERFLTTHDIDRATASIQSQLPTINKRYHQQLEEQNQRVEARRAELNRINDEIDVILGIKSRTIKPAGGLVPFSVEKIAKQAAPQDSIFSENDRR